MLFGQCAGSDESLYIHVKSIGHFPSSMEVLADRSLISLNPSH